MESESFIDQCQHAHILAGLITFQDADINFDVNIKQKCSETNYPHSDGNIQK